MIAAWACLLVSNGLAAASPVYGFNVLDGTAHGVTIQFSAVCFMDVAIALSKTAFATTLLRLTRGRRDKAILWATIVVVNSFNLAMVVANWRKLFFFICRICNPSSLSFLNKPPRVVESPQSITRGPPDNSRGARGGVRQRGSCGTSRRRKKRNW